MDKKSEILAVENTLKLLRRGKWEMEGEEMLAFSQCFHFWIKKLQELQKPDMIINKEEPVKTPEKKPKKKE